MDFYIQQIQYTNNQTNRQEVIFFIRTHKPTYFIISSLEHISVFVDSAVLDAFYAVNRTKTNDLIQIILNNRIYIQPLFRWKGSHLEKILSTTSLYSSYYSNIATAHINTLEGRSLLSNLADYSIKCTSNHDKYDSLDCLLDLVNVMYLDAISNNCI